MKGIILDIDTLRPDHLGCYGYERSTSPTIDSIAEEGIRFENYYCSDAPCLPSRAALFTGRMGIHNGVSNHGGTTGDLRLLGSERLMRDQRLENGLFGIFRKAGMYTASISSFAERHSAFWFHAGLNETINVGKGGDESADDVMPLAIDWIERHKSQDNWLLHINLWDPHTPYRTPDEMNHLFENDPIPKWITNEVIEKNLSLPGPHSLHELFGFSDKRPVHWAEFEKSPGSATTYDEVKHLIDLYDCGVRYADDWIGKLLNCLKEQGIYEDMVIIVTSDHGETFGELGIWAEHGCCDNITTRIPMIIKWPGISPGVDNGLHYHLDLLPTLAELLNVPVNEKWDGQSYLPVLTKHENSSRKYLVLTQGAHVAQRGVRFGNWFYIRTYHDGYHLYPKEMLFNITEDPHEQNNLAKDYPNKCAEACRYLVDWQQNMMETCVYPIDPIFMELTEKGPLHAFHPNIEEYYNRLEITGRKSAANEMRTRKNNYKSEEDV